MLQEKENKKAVLVETFYLDRFEERFLSKNCFHIIILKNGSLTAQINQKSCHITSPSIICLDDKKEVYITSNSTSFVKIIKFDPIILNSDVNYIVGSIHSEHICQKHITLQLTPFLTDLIDDICIKLTPESLTKVERIFNNMTHHLSNQTDWYWPYRVRSYLLELVCLIERLYFNFFDEEYTNIPITISIPNELQTILTHIDTHLDEPQTLDLLYSKFRINKNQIESLFKKFLHVTFYEYLRNKRYEEATYLLCFTELTGDQIASRIGLSSSQNFCKFFKSICGRTPNSFRKNNSTNFCFFKNKC